MNGDSATVALAYLVFVFTLLAAWATHVIVCIKGSMWLFLIAGAIAAPVGVVHGVGIWLGVW